MPNETPRDSSYHSLGLSSLLLLLQYLGGTCESVVNQNRLVKRKKNCRCRVDQQPKHIDTTEKTIKYPKKRFLERATRMMRLVRNASRRFSSGSHVSEEVILRKNRKRINQYIRKIGREVDLELSLDSHGFCCIPFKKFLIIIEVPADHPEYVYFDTKVFDMGLSPNPPKVYQRVTSAQTQNVRFGKQGSTLRIEEDEFILSCSRPIGDLNFKKMVECFEDFMQTAMNTNRDLAAII